MFAKADPCPREEFTRQMSVLCAAFGVPMGDRLEAYERAFGRLGLDGVVRLFDAAIGPDTDFEKMPTVPQLRALQRRSKIQVREKEPPGRQAALVEFVLRHRRLSDRQRSSIWNWIARSWPDPRPTDAERKGYEFLGVIVPQDDSDPATYPSHRVLFADVEWQQYLEDGRGNPVKPQAAFDG